MNNDIQRIRDLVRELNIYRNAYYNENQSLISDIEYDILFDELKNLECKTGTLLSNSPTRTVGFDVVSKLNKVAHKTPLLSLDKTKSLNELMKFIDNKEVLIMAKADGLTNELIYNDGELIQASTRGNGEVGEDVTHNAKTYRNIPLKIPFKGHLRLSGECIIHNSDFDKINKNLPKEERYKTPRNLTSGSVRQLDSNICNDRNVYFYAFNLLEVEDIKFYTKYQQLQWLTEQGFIPIPHTLLFFDTIHLVEQTINEIKLHCGNIGLPIDGMVITYNDIEYSKSLGRTGHHYLDGIAYKFEDETAITMLRRIEWSVGRTGIITPVAIFDTVELDGTEVSRASLHNLTIMNNLRLGVGDEIEIYKANMIIPQVLKNYTQSNNIDIPINCPVCNGETVQSTLNESTVLRCTNTHCPSQLLARFSHFVSREAMNIDGLSEATLEKFINAGLLKTFVDIFKLEYHKDTIVNMDGFGEKSYENLIEAINKSRYTTLDRVIYAVGIPNVGRTLSKAISEYFDYDPHMFISALREEFDFTELKDIGDTINKSIHQWWRNEWENNLRKDLGSYIHFNIVEKSSVDSNSVFNGKKIYATGAFANYKKEEIKTIIEALGGEFANGYAKSLDYLIVGSIKSSSKEEKAKKDGVKVLTEQEFSDIIK